MLDKARTSWQRLRHRPVGAEQSSLHAPSALPMRPLRVLSFNIQAGIGTRNYHQYVTRSWRHFISDSKLMPLLDDIGKVISDFDIVALQEVDAGSLRSGFINQVEYLAEQGGFEFWHKQVNRNLGRFGQFCNGLLSRYVPYQVENHRLPGLRGRGALVARFGNPKEPLIVIGLHLALTERARFWQLGYVRDLVRTYEHVIVMGDMNCGAECLVDTPLRDTHLQPAATALNTFPAWAPARNIDHILVSPSLRVEHVQVLDCTLSDHRPIAMDVILPNSALAV